MAKSLACLNVGRLVGCSSGGRQQASLAHMRGTPSDARAPYLSWLVPLLLQSRTERRCDPLELDYPLQLKAPTPGQTPRCVFQVRQTLDELQQQCMHMYGIRACASGAWRRAKDGRHGLPTH